MKGFALFEGEIKAKSKNTLKTFKSFLLQNQQAKFYQTWYCTWVKGIQVCSNKGPGSLQRGDNHKNGVVLFKNLLF
jgi:hypothetical protein